VRSNSSVINVYKKNNIRSKVVTQLLYGDTFRKIKKNGNWLKIKNDLDNYKGYIKYKKFPTDCKNTHKVSVLFSDLYSKPNNKNKIKKKLSFGSRINVSNKKNSFYKFDNLWIKKKNLKKINVKIKDNFKTVSKFVNVKYRWGGKHFTGIDCSALIQLFLNFNNKFCPRDTKNQIKYFKNKIKLEKIKKNDLIFWKGHVAIVMSKKKVMHAYGPAKKVVIMPLKETIRKIYKTANLKVTGIRRIA